MSAPQELLYFEILEEIRRRGFPIGSGFLLVNDQIVGTISNLQVTGAPHIDTRPTRSFAENLGALADEHERLCESLAGPSEKLPMWRPTR